MSNDLLTVQVPSGIGDISWLWSKLRHVALERPIRFEAATGWPFRAAEYLELLPELHSHGYCELEFRDIASIVAQRNWKTWAEASGLGSAILPLENNMHLERGKPLAAWFPDLPVDYHYPLATTDDYKDRAEKLLGDLNGRVAIGVSCASYRGANAWKTWSGNEWVDLLVRLASCERFHNQPPIYVMMGGGWDDLTREVGERLDTEHGLEVRSTVGRTHFGVAVELHRRLHYYIGFSSGLGIVRTVLRKPTFMLWPEHQVPLSTSWADPEDLCSALYRVSGYVDPEIVYWAVLAQWREIGLIGG